MASFVDGLNCALHVCYMRNALGIEGIGGVHFPDYIHTIFQHYCDISAL